jgi:hypothetical protein
MANIKLEFECTAPDGKCAYNTPDCIDQNSDGNSWVCPWLKATRKIEKIEVPEIEQKLEAELEEEEAYIAARKAK